jgi:branched-chain amino acid transport system ATP-binding protein
MDILTVEGVSKHFGGVTAVNDFSMVQPEKIISAIIGPNGAGKTTTFNLITGVQPADSGKMTFQGRDMARLPAHARTKAGITRTFQNIRLFPDMDVLDNLKVVYGMHRGYSIWDELLRSPRVKREEKALHEKAMSLLAEFKMEQFAHYRPTQLPYGTQRRLELARALLPGPSLLLLDEPGAGLNPKEIRELMDSIVRIQQERGLSIIVVEHHMELVMNICSIIHVLDFGKKIAQGSPAEISCNEAVQRAYLGE